MLNYISTHAKGMYYKGLAYLNLCECGLTDDTANEEIYLLKDAIQRAEKNIYRNQGIVRIDTKKLRAWSLRVREIGECDICKSPDKLTAHHLYDKRMHPTLMYQDENGVCLCETHHNGFHKQYTSKSHTTPAMYNKYKMGTESAILLEQNRKERFDEK